ncbi:MAG: hypothetical protein GY781_01590 [Gammaproteobacteria bacterium]|nr:hypothetical protein [Gammaproteobacteria bacterium]
MSNSRLISFGHNEVTFKWKDYRGKKHIRYKTMTLSADEFIRRFLIHVLPGRFHRIRHYGLLANSGRQDNLKRARELLKNQTDEVIQEKGAIEVGAPETNKPGEALQVTYVCPKCNHPMIIIES